MKSTIILSSLVAALSAPTAIAGNAAVEAPIHRMMAAFKKGDIAAVKAEHVAAPTIVDNVAPFRWSGPNAFDQWLHDLGESEAKIGRVDGSVVFAPVVDQVVAGDRAYVVARSVYSFKQKGKPMREAGYTSFTLVKLGGAWKVESWSWASPSAVPLK